MGKGSVHGLDFVKKVVKSSSASSDTKAKVSGSIDNKKKRSSGYASHPSSKPKKEYEKKIDQELGLPQFQETKEGPQPVYVKKEDSRKEIITTETGEKKVVKKPLTFAEYSDVTYRNYQDIQKGKQSLEAEMSSIDPSQEYIITDKFGQEAVIKGWALKKEYYSPIYDEYVKAESQAQSNYQQSLSLHKDTKIYKLGNKYNVVAPDTSLDFTKRSFKKIDYAYKINPVLGGVAEFGFGALSSFAALGKPVAQVFEPKISNIHYVSPMDVVFEPIGWSPKGSTDILKKRPVFSLGGVGSEFLQGVAISKAVGYTGKITSKSIKGITKTIPKAYSKMGKTFPKVFGTVTTEYGEKVGSRTGVFISKVGKTKVGKNVYNWAVKGYKPAKTFVYKSGKLGEKLGFRKQSFKYVLDKSKVREFLPESSFQKLKNKLASSNKINIGFPSSKTDDIIFAAEGGVFKKSVKGGFKGYKLTKTEVLDIGKIVPIKDKTYNRLGRGSLYWEKEAAEKMGVNYTGQILPVKDFGELPLSDISKQFRIKAQMYSEGYGYKFTTLESGKQIIDFTTGFGGSGISPPMPKSWINKAKYGLVKSKEATASLIRKNKTIFKTPSKFQSLSIKPSIKMPAQFSTKGLTPLIYTSSKIGMKTISAQKLQYKSELQTPIISVHSEGKRIYKTPSIKQRIKSKQMEDVLKIPIMKQAQGTMLKTDVITSKVTSERTAPAKTIKIPDSTNTFSKSINTKIGMPLLIPPMPDMGFGIKGYDFKSYKSKYRFRKFEIPKLGGVKL